MFCKSRGDRVEALIMLLRIRDHTLRNTQQYTLRLLALSQLLQTLIRILFLIFEKT